MNLSEFLDFEARALEADFAGLTAGEATPRAIRRRRAVRTGATAGVATVGIGVVALGGLRVAGSDAPEPGAADAQVAPYPDELKAQLLDPEGDPRFSPYAYVPACGEPAPAVDPRVEDIHFSMGWGEEQRLDALARNWGSTVNGWLDNMRDEPLRASVSNVALVWVQDGTVVAYSESPVSAQGMLMTETGFFGQTSPKRVQGRLDAFTYTCDSPVNGPWRTVGVGTYEVYPVVRVVGSYTDAETNKGGRVDFPLVAAPLTVHVDSTWEQYQESIATVSPMAASVMCGMTLTRDQYVTEGVPTVAVWPDDASMKEGGGALVVYFNDFLNAPMTVELPESIDVWLLDARTDDWLVVGSAEIRIDGSRFVRLTKWGESKMLTAEVVSIEYCTDVPEQTGSYGVVEITVTDANGVRTDTVPIR